MRPTSTASLWLNLIGASQLGISMFTRNFCDGSPEGLAARTRERSPKTSRPTQILDLSIMDKAKGPTAITDVLWSRLYIVYLALSEVPMHICVLAMMVERGLRWPVRAAHVIQGFIRHANRSIGDHPSPVHSLSCVDDNHSCQRLHQQHRKYFPDVSFLASWHWCFAKSSPPRLTADSTAPNDPMTHSRAYRL